MLVSLMVCKCFRPRALLAFSLLCLVQFCQAVDNTNVDQQLILGQSAFGLGDFSAMNIAIVAALGVVGLAMLAWLVRRMTRRSRLSSSRAQRHDLSGLEGTASDRNLLARARPEKTEVVRSIVIGSEPDVDVRFTNEGVSTRHAELLVLRQVDSSPLMPLEPTYYIRDMASARGIEVMRDGEWMRFHADVVLDDEQLRIGDEETTAEEINQLAITTKLAETVTDSAL